MPNECRKITSLPIFPASSTTTFPSLFSVLPHAARRGQVQKDAEASAHHQPAVGNFFLLLKGRGRGCLPAPQLPEEVNTLLMACSNICHRQTQDACRMCARADEQQHDSCGNLLSNPLLSIHADNLSHASCTAGVEREMFTLHARTGQVCATGIGPVLGSPVLWL